MKQGFCLLMAVLLLWTAVPGIAVEIEPLGFRTVPMVAAGSQHTLALRNDGTVWAWGDNWNWQLGGGTTEPRTNPIQVRNLTNVIAIGAGWGHSAALRSDGIVWAWGCNESGVLGDGTFMNRTAPVQVRNLTNVIAIAVGGNHTLALRSDGTVWAWGLNFHGQLGDGTKTDRTTPVQVQGLTNVIAIAADGHSAAIRDDGTIWTWGDLDWERGWQPRSIIPMQVHGLTNMTAVSVGFLHTLALRNDGTVWAWGRNFGALGDGTIYDSATPVQVRGLTNATSIAAGDSHSVAARDDGTVWAWGRGFEGQLGNGTTRMSTTPVQVHNLNHVISMDADRHTVAVRNDGTVWVWGEVLPLEWDWYEQFIFNTTPTQVRGPGGSGFLNLGTPPTPGRTHFNDVWLDDWFHDAVEFAHTYNIMQGTSTTTFSPRMNVSRAQVVATLYRMEHGGTAREIPYAHNRPVFNDVEASAWYSPYIIWAYDYDIVAGIGGNRFGPNRNVTREQFAAMLHRFAGFTGHDMTASVGPQWGSFADLYQIGTWAGAREALTWANYHGLITGRSSTTIVPAGTAQRAEAAAILMRFIQTLGTAAPLAEQ